MIESYLFSAGNFCAIDQHPEIVQSVISTENCFSDVRLAPPYSTDDLKSNFRVGENLNAEKKTNEGIGEGKEESLTKNSSPALKSTKKSQRGRVKDETSTVQSVNPAQPDPKINSLSETVFQDLNLKMSVLEGHHDDICALDLFGDFIVSGG